jgi:hypothetical protein
MDANGFDMLLRSLSASPSRRRTLRLLAGSALAGLLGQTVIHAVDAHDLLPSCKKKSGKAKKKCLKKAKAHNATHTVAPPTGTTGDPTPVDPCAGVRCGAVPHGMSTCQNGTCVVTSCEGDNYDVDGNAANGCEVADDGVNSHSLTNPTQIGTLSCGASVSRSGNIVSDHLRAAAADFFAFSTSCPAGTFVITLVTSGGSLDFCYKYSVFIDDGSPPYDLQLSQEFKGVGGALRRTFDTAGDQRFVISLEKTCSSSVGEAISYTLTLALTAR